MIQQTEVPVSPQPILNLLFAPLGTAALFSATELEIFTHVDRGIRDLDKLAQVLACEGRGLEILLQTLVRLGFLTRDPAGAYALTPVSAAYLVKGKPGYLGGLVTFSPRSEAPPPWKLLTPAVRQGTPARTPTEGDEDDGAFFAELVENIYPLSSYQAEWIARTLEVEKWPGEPRVLDLGAGTGVWSLPMARLHPRLRVTAVDRQRVLQITRRYAEKYGVGERYEYLPGNFRDVDFGKSRYDLVILGHICHSEGRTHSQALLKRGHEALKPSGKILIAEILPDEKSAHRLFVNVFALNMLLATEEGDTFTQDELTAWLREAGFTHVNGYSPTEHGVVEILVAEKK